MINKDVTLLVSFVELVKGSRPVLFKSEVRAAVCAFRG